LLARAFRLDTVGVVTRTAQGPLDAATVADATRALLHAAHRIEPDRLAELAASVASRCGVVRLAIWVADHEERALVHLSDPGDDGEQGTEVATIDIDGTMAGRAFTASEPVEAARDGGPTLWLPLMDGVDRIGVLEVDIAGTDGSASELLAPLVSVIAAEIVSRGQYGDVFKRARRRREMSLAAEIIFEMLPPRTFATDDITISGALEPAYEVGGDSFDYALDGSTLHFGILDAVGHGLASSLAATLAMNACRNARRAGSALFERYVTVDRVIAERFTDRTFVTAHLAELDTTTGVLRWVNAGHPPPLLMRNGHIVGPLECPPCPPLGLGHLTADRPPVVATQQLQPGDAVLLYTDGVVEARTAQGVDFGLDRLGEFLHRAMATGLPAAEILRRLSHAVVDHHGGILRDDAATVLVHWHPRPAA
jgi:serine phosphatase RsbU (regulator of sigma subunit)